MDKPFKFALPSPNFNKNAKDAFKPKPHFLTPSGMSLLPREKQPPPMYGKHGATIPSKYLQQQVVKEPQLVVDAAPPPTPDKQYCEPCELELHSMEDLKRHRAQHEKCPVAGCLFKGHPTVMDKHINALHATGLFDKFKKLSTPEEIAAWREERRKRYPTLANVLLKQKAQEQRQKRGERLEANKNRFGKINDRKRAQPNRQEDKNNLEDKKLWEDKKASSRNNKRNRNKNKRNQKANNQDQKPKVQNKVNQDNKDQKEEGELVREGIRMFRGTSQLNNYKHFHDKKNIVASNALFGLLGMYGSDNDDESVDNEESENEKDEEKIDTTKVIQENESNSDNSTIETTTEVCESKEIVETDNDNKMLRTGLISENQEVCNNAIIEEVGKEISQTTTVSDGILGRALLMPNGNILINKSLTENNVNETKENPVLNHNENSSDEGPEETPIQRSLPHYSVKKEINQNNTLNKEPPTKRSKPTEQPATFKQKQLIKRKSGLDYRKARLRKQNTMLEKLLEGDIRHERNVLLQCVRYVCENNFFGIGQTNQEKPG